MTVAGRGFWQFVVGGVLAITSLFLLVPGLNGATLVGYTEPGGDLAHAIVLLAVGVALLLPGAAFLLIGFCVLRASNNRTRGYADRSADQTLATEDRRENPYRNPAQGFSTGSPRASRGWRPARHPRAHLRPRSRVNAHRP